MTAAAARAGARAAVRRPGAAVSDISVNVVQLKGGRGAPRSAFIIRM